MASNVDVDLPGVLAGQLEFHWSRLTRPRLEGLTDQEYFGEPVQGCWTLRPRNDSAGELVMDRGSTDEDPPPFTTIAWRFAHVTRHIAKHGAHLVADVGGSEHQQSWMFLVRDAIEQDALQPRQITDDGPPVC